MFFSQNVVPPTHQLLGNNCILRADKLRSRKIHSVITPFKVGENEHLKNILKICKVEIV